MSFRSGLRATCLSAVVALISACGAEDLTAPDAPVDVPASTISANQELLINIASPTYDEGTAPSFSLASLPSTIMAGPNGRLVRTIAIQTNSAFGGANVAVDYGRGAGPQSVSLSQSSGNYSFQIAQTYPTPGTYIIRVGASTAEGRSIRSHTLTVTPDLSVYVDSVVVFGAEPEVRGGAVEEGVETHFRWWWRGRANIPGTIRIEHGDGSSESFAATPGTASASHTWATAGTYTLRVIATQETYVDTASVQVVVAAPLACTAGSYLADGACVPAPPGSYVEMDGATEATLCPWGFYQPQAGQQACIASVPGSFVAEPGQTAATLCPAGTFSSRYAAIECDTAPEGTFVAVAGASNFTRCTPGSYQPLRAQTSCLATPAGTFAATYALQAPTPCPVGRYQPLTGQASCLLAPAGSFVATTGQIAATPCPVGTYQPTAGQSVCLSAPIGSFVDQIGAAAATACPAGSTTIGMGSTSISQCLTPSAITLDAIDDAVDAGTLSGVGSGVKGASQLSGWVRDVHRSIGFITGPQKQAGCVGLRNQLAKADGRPGPTDQVTGPARAAIAARLQQLLDENCR